MTGINAGHGRTATPYKCGSMPDKCGPIPDKCGPMPSIPVASLQDNRESIVMGPDVWRKIVRLWTILMIMLIFSLCLIICLKYAKAEMSEELICTKNMLIAMQAILKIRDIPTIQSMSALPFLNIPHLERTEKGFKLRGRDYEATYERVSPVESEEDTNADANAKQSPPKEQPEPDYALTVVKGKTHFWKARAGKPLALHKIELHDETKPKEPSPPANAIPAEDGTAKI